MGRADGILAEFILAVGDKEAGGEILKKKAVTNRKELPRNNAEKPST